jgi:predicted O-methyltransferase YrrM
VLHELISRGLRALTAAGEPNRTWMERHWNFAEQWQCFWRPAIEATSDGQRGCNQKSRKQERSAKQNEKVSVIVPHGGHERLPLLAATLASLRQAAAVGEVIVVEMGVSPVAAEVVACWDCRHLFIEHDGAFERARALNAGTAIASHETIVWHDNDLLHAPAFLGRAAAELRARSLDFLLPYSAVHYLNEFDSLAVIRGERAPANAVPASSLAKSTWIGCVGVVRREFVLRHGGMIEGFRGWGGEDNAWFHKAYRCGQVAATKYTDQPVYHLYHPLCGWTEPGRAGSANPHYANNVERLRRVLATRCAADLAERFPTIPPTLPSSTKPLRNVFACLVHESPECILDLVRNLRFLDPESVLIVYNGGPDHDVIARAALPRDEKVIIHPKPRPLSSGSVHPFALDCMALALEQTPFDTLTIVDSDQLALRAGYSQFLARHLAKEENVGLLGNSPEPQPRGTRISPAAKAWQEVELWRPFLRNFRDGEAKFVHWSFWPSTVITGTAARELVAIFRTNRRLQEVLDRSRLSATEEILFPTLTALLGFRVIANPCKDHFVQYRKNHSEADFQYALDQSTTFWMHPVPRQYGHVFRCKLRDRFAHYSRASTVSSGSTTMITKQDPANTPLFTILPVIECKNRIEGWLEDDEADLLLAAARLALESTASLALVEIGSYCGRSTVVLASAVRAFRPQAKVFAIDPFDGDIGAADVGVQHNGSTLERFQKNVASAGVADFVKTIAQHSYEVKWNQAISLLFIDHLHDYANVARDFRQFERWLCDQGLVVFHDFADSYPGVQAFVRELLGTGEFEQLRLVGTLAVLRKKYRKGASRSNASVSRKKLGKRARRD